MNIAAIKEAGDESRTSISPQSGERLIKSGHSVVVEAGIGEASFFTDQEYSKAGVSVAASAAAALARAELVTRVGAPSASEVKLLTAGTILIGFLGVHTDRKIVARLAPAGVTSLAMELVPRIARAQALDALSSQASIAGYKATLIVADSLGKYLPMLITAAGTIPPSKVLVIGAGVAGLQAIATARRLGAVVSGFDVRSAAGEQVASLGAKFISPPAGAESTGTGGYAATQSEDAQQRVREFLAPHVIAADAVITTAAIPGARAPLLITEDTVRQMRSGTVIVDLAAENGGNCESTRAGEAVTVGRVTVHGLTNAARLVPQHASTLYSQNVAKVIDAITDKDGKLTLNLDDEIVMAMCVTHNGNLVGFATPSPQEEPR